ncbi:MAG: RraA family protein [Burkholderiales bacterium]|nr:RraA family protein [Burkholderiales bacterium]
MLHGIEINHRIAPFADGIKALSGIPTSILGDVTGRLIGTVGLHPVNKSFVSACGNAVTVRVRAGDNLLIHRALRMLKPGDFLVVDGEGDISRALFGEIMMNIAKAKGAIACVFDAAIRDVNAFEENKFPCWARGINSRGPYKDGPGAINVPVSVGGLVINPGDVVLGDPDGIVAFSPKVALEVARLGKEKVVQETATIQAILNGSYDDSWIDKVLEQKGYK